MLEENLFEPDPELDDDDVIVFDEDEDGLISRYPSCLSLVSV